MSDLLNGVKITYDRKRLVEKEGGHPSFITNLEVAEYCQKMNYKLRMIGRISFSYDHPDGSRQFLMVQACRARKLTNTRS